MKFPASFYAARRGEGCAICQEGRPAAYWLEVLRVAHALEGHLKPIKMNYNVLGNSVPHLHTHLIPRYADDPRPGWPFPFPERDPEPIEDTLFQSDLKALRKLLA